MNPRVLVLVLFSSLLFATAAWLARGVYDNSMRGQIMIANYTREDRLIRVVFPSGTTIEGKVGKNHSTTIRVEDRGEGNVEIYADGKLKGGCYIADDDITVVLQLNEHDFKNHTFRKASKQVTRPEAGGWKVR